MLPFVSSRVTSGILRAPCPRIHVALQSRLPPPTSISRPLSKRYLPRLARPYSDKKDAKHDGLDLDERQKESLSFAKELEKEETTGDESALTQFEKDAALFRKQTGMPEPELEARTTPIPIPAPMPPKQVSQAQTATAEATEHPELRNPVVSQSYRSELFKEDPSYEQPKYEQEVGRPRVWKQALFAFSVSLVVWAHASELTNSDTRRASSVFPQAFMLSNEHLRRLRITAISDRLKKGMQMLKDSLANVPNSLSFPVLWSYVQVANGYINASEGKRAAYQIVAVNGIVWLLWQVKALGPFMSRHFMHHPLSGKSYTLLTCIFSHQSLLHYAMNSFALISFGSAASTYLVKRQAENKRGMLESTPKYHFWALFISAGLFSSFVSHAVAARFTFPRVLAQLRSAEAATTAATTGVSNAFRRAASTVRTNTKRTGDILPSLGASGAIYATVTISALAFPDAQVFLLFPPIPLPITWGVGGMVCMDIMGIIKGWRLFDHWAHLSGAMFGVLYYFYGPGWWDGWRFTSEDSAREYLERKAKKNQD